MGGKKTHSYYTGEKFSSLDSGSAEKKPPQKNQQLPIIQIEGG